MGLRQRIVRVDIFELLDLPLLPIGLQILHDLAVDRIFIILYQLISMRSLVWRLTVVSFLDFFYALQLQCGVCLLPSLHLNRQLITAQSPLPKRDSCLFVFPLVAHVF